MQPNTPEETSSASPGAVDQTTCSEPSGPEASPPEVPFPLGPPKGKKSGASGKPRKKRRRKKRRATKKEASSGDKVFKKPLFMLPYRPAMYSDKFLARKAAVALPLWLQAGIEAGLVGMAPHGGVSAAPTHHWSEPIKKIKGYEKTDLGKVLKKAIEKELEDLKKDGT